MSTQDMMVAAFEAMRDTILKRLDAILAEEVADLSAIAPQHAVGYNSGFKRGINTAREAIEAMMRDET